MSKKKKDLSDLSVSERCKIAVKLDQFKPRDGMTFCNVFVHYISCAYGCSEFEGLLANHIYDILDQREDLFLELEPDQAQLAANNNQLVIAAWKNPAGHPGHVCIVVKGELYWSKAFKDDVPVCANVGTSNFYGRPISYAFRSNQKPRYWMHLGGLSGTRESEDGGD